VTYRSRFGDESDACFDIGGCGAESASTVVREGATLAVGRDVAVAPAVAAEAPRHPHVARLGPAIDAVESGDRYVTTGTTGRVRVGGAWLPFRVTACNGRRWDWRIAGIPATGHRVDSYAGESDRSRVVVEVPIVAAWYVTVCRARSTGSRRWSRSGRESDRSPSPSTISPIPTPTTIPIPTPTTIPIPTPTPDDSRSFCKPLTSRTLPRTGRSPHCRAPPRRG